jgi:putative membrane protein
MHIIAKWFMSALALLAADYFIEGISVESLYIALIVALLLGLLNAIVRPVLILLTLPVTVLTLGLFIFVINGSIFWFLSTFIQDFHVDGLWSGILGALVVSVFSWIGNRVIEGPSSSRQVREYHG